MIVKPVHNPSEHPEMTPKQYSAYHRKKYQEWFRATHKKPTVAKDSNGEAPVRKIKPREEVVPMALTSCPFCGSRFYGCRGNESEKEP